MACLLRAGNVRAEVGWSNIVIYLTGTPVLATNTDHYAWNMSGPYTWIGPNTFTNAAPGDMDFAAGEYKGDGTINTNVNLPWIQNLLQEQWQDGTGTHDYYIDPIGPNAAYLCPLINYNATYNFYYYNDIYGNSYHVNPTDPPPPGFNSWTTYIEMIDWIDTHSPRWHWGLDTFAPGKPGGGVVIPPGRAQPIAIAKGRGPRRADPTFDVTPTLQVLKAGTAIGASAVHPWELHGHAIRCRPAGANLVSLHGQYSPYVGLLTTKVSSRHLVLEAHYGYMVNNQFVETLVQK